MLNRRELGLHSLEAARPTAQQGRSSKSNDPEIFLVPMNLTSSVTP